MKLHVGRKGYEKGLVLTIDKYTSLDEIAAIIDKMKHNPFIAPLGYSFLTLVLPSNRISSGHKNCYSCSISL